MASTLYRRQSMDLLYKKLRAHDDDDDMAWLAQYSPDDKFDEQYNPPAPSPPSLSTISSVSPVSSYSSSSSISDPTFDSESCDEYFDCDSESDVDPEPLSLDLPTAAFDPPTCSLILQSNDPTPVTEPLEPTYISSVQEVSPPQLRSSPPSTEHDMSPAPIIPALSIASRRTTRYNRNASARYHSPVVPRDFNEDAYSESDGNGTEDEYIPSPVPGSKKRPRSTRSAPSSTAASQKRTAHNAPHKRPRHSPLPRNTQADPEITSAPPVSKSNPWACPFCKWVQRNHRTPDLKRHIRTHTRLQRPAQWVCCGVPVEDVMYYNLPADAEPYIWGGERMVGGCCKEFSRRDALKRHLDNDHINCIGNFAAFAKICEDEVAIW